MDSCVSVSVLRGEQTGVTETEGCPSRVQGTVGVEEDFLLSPSELPGRGIAAALRESGRGKCL